VTEPRVEPVALLLKHGRPTPYLTCDCCGQYVRWRRSEKRRWCQSCEEEFRVVLARLRLGCADLVGGKP